MALPFVFASINPIQSCLQYSQLSVIVTHQPWNLYLNDDLAEIYRHAGAIVPFTEPHTNFRSTFQTGKRTLGEVLKTV